MSPLPPLLGPDFELMDCARFLLRVVGMRKVPAPRKPVKKPDLLSGRWLERPTRKRFGEYELEYRGKLFRVPAPKDMAITPEQVDEVCNVLGCDRAPLEALLLARKFRIVTLDAKGELL